MDPRGQNSPWGARQSNKIRQHNYNNKVVKLLCQENSYQKLYRACPTDTNEMAIKNIGIWNRFNRVSDPSKRFPSVGLRIEFERSGGKPATYSGISQSHSKSPVGLRAADRTKLDHQRICRRCRRLHDPTKGAH